MTVQNLITMFEKEKDLFVPSQYASQSIEHFVKIWDDLNPTKQKDLKKLADFCKSAIEFQTPPQETLKTVIETAEHEISLDTNNVNREDSQVIGETGEANAVRDEDVTIDILPAIYITRNDTIQSLIRKGVPLRTEDNQASATRLLNFFDGGNKTVQNVLDTTPQMVRKIKGNGRKVIQCLDDWQTTLNLYLERFSNIQYQQDRTNNEYRKHPCMRLPINAFIGINAPFTGRGEFNILAKPLKLFDCKVIKDLFDIDEQRFASMYDCANNRQSVRTKKFLKLKKDIMKQPEKYDEMLHNIERMTDSIERHPIVQDNEHTLSTFEQVVLSLQQIADELAQSANSSIQSKTINAFFLENQTSKEIARKLGEEGGPGNPESYRKMMANFSIDLLNETANLNNNFSILSSDLLESIESDMLQYQYKSLDIFCKDKGLEVPYVKQHSQILSSFFNLYIACPSLKDTEAYWSHDVNFLIPSAATKAFGSNVLKTIYQTLRTYIFPLSIDEIQDLLLKDNSQEPCFIDIDILRRIIEGYIYIERFDGQEPSYRLKLQYFDDKYQMALVAYDRAPNRLTSLEIKDIIYNLTGNRSRTNNYVQSGLPSGLQSYFTIIDNVWTYQPNAKPKNSSILVFVHEFVERHKVFHINSLKNAISSQYQTITDTSLLNYVYRFCVQATDASGVFCIDKEVDNYPEHKWHIRKDSERLNFCINFIRKYIENTSLEWVSAEELRSHLLVALEENGYSVYPIQSIIQKFADEDGSTDKPFIRKDENKTYFLRINSNTSIDWDTIGLRGDIPFREAIIAKVVQTLRCAPNCECEREEIYSACLSLFEDTELTNRSKIHRVLYNHLPSNLVSWYSKDKKVYFKLNQIPEEIACNYTIKEETSQNDDESNTIATPLPTNQIDALPFNARPTPNRDIFISSLTRHIQQYGNISEQLNDVITPFVDFIMDAESEKINDTIVQFWYEYLNYRVDKYSIRSTYDQSLVALEEYVRLLSVKLLSRRIYGTQGIVDTVKEVSCIESWYLHHRAEQYARPRGQYNVIWWIYDHVYNDRNQTAHGKDFREGRDLYSSTADIIILYVYFYKLVKDNYIYPEHSTLFTESSN